ncbi:MAG: hypothetical protein EOO17_01510 [Chloroflexi bacterium]|nr:MAG: hypothetical protein EOO17_01510 [Chloroflexota bacterium]
MQNLLYLHYMKNLQLSKPHLLVVVGIPGAGKSFFASKFAETFSAPYIDQESLYNMVDPDHVEAVADLILDQLVRTKQTILLEGWGATRTERQAFTAYGRKHGYEPLFIWVQTEPITAKKRATKGVRGHETNNLVSPEEFDKAVTRFTPLNASERYMVISGKHTYASQAKIVLKKLTGDRGSLHTVAPRHVDNSPLRGRITVN